MGNWQNSSTFRGIKLGFPIFIAYLPVAAAFGILAKSVGFSTIQTILCATFVLSGAGQFIALAMINVGADIPSILAATSIANLRYVLFSATLAPHLLQYKPIDQSKLAFTVTDETFGINVADLQDGHADKDSMNGVGLTAWLGWVAGTILGSNATDMIRDPSQWGVDFAMAAMFTTLLVAQIKNRKLIVVGIMSILLGIVFWSILPGQWFLVATPIATATLAAVIFNDA